MTKELLSNLKFGNRFYGVEQTQLDGEDKYYGVVLKKKRKQLDIETSFGIGGLDEFKTQIPKGKPIVLIINTNSVLTKCVQSNTNDSLKLVHIAFPNIKVEDFYYEVVSQAENHFISICRKVYVDDLLKDYALKHIAVIDFTLGSLISSVVTPFIDSDNIKTSNASISIEDKLIIDIKTKESQVEGSYAINGINIKSNQLLSFSGALNLVVKSQYIQSSFVDVKKELKSTFKQKVFANQFLKIGLSLLFMALLINFLFFNHYYNEVNSLRETSQILEVSKTKMLSLNEKVQKTEKMVEDVLKSSASKSSFYVDAIINTLPESILLKELNYQPLLKKIKEDKPIEHQKNTILISGKTNKSILFSGWISQLETKPWVTSVNILSFEDITKSSSNFKVKLNMKDDAEN